MKLLLWILVVLAFAGSLFAGWIVAHAYTDHGHLDAFHLVVTLVSAGVALVLLRRLVRTPA